MRWEWKWDESYLTRTRRGERKRRGKEKTHTNTPSPERANPEKAREKKKRRVDGHGPRPTEGGEDGSAWTNLTQRKPTKTSARDGANLPGEGRKHEIGDQWGTSWWKQNQTTNKIQFLNLEVVRCANPGPCSGQPQGHKTASKFQRIRCTICLTSPDNQKEKRPHLKDMCLPFHNDLTWCRVTAKVAAKNGGFRLFSSSFTWKSAEHSRISWDIAGAAGDSRKWLTNRKARLLQFT